MLQRLSHAVGKGRHRLGSNRTGVSFTGVRSSSSFQGPVAAPHTGRTHSCWSCTNRPQSRFISSPASYHTYGKRTEYPTRRHKTYIRASGSHHSINQSRSPQPANTANMQCQGTLGPTVQIHVNAAARGECAGVQCNRGSKKDATVAAQTRCLTSICNPNKPAEQG